MLSLLSKFRTREPLPERRERDDRDLIAFVNEARTEAQRLRFVEFARRRAAGR